MHLPRTALHRVDRRLFVTVGNVEGGPGWIAYDVNALVNVTDSVLEHDEQLRAVVDAKSCTGATVLIDPDLHDGFLRHDRTPGDVSAETLFRDPRAPGPRVIPAISGYPAIDGGLAFDCGC